MNHKRSYTVCSILAFLALSALAIIGGMMVVHAAPRQAATITFTGAELLGKPTDTSIAINIIPDSTIEYFYEYGTVSGTYPYSTTLTTATASQPSEVVINGLTANTRYYYRMKYHAPGDAMNDWVTRSENWFWTQRAKGSTFTFTVTSDSHANMNASHQNAMTSILGVHPDFHVDLGDTFMVDNTTSQSAVNTKYLAYRGALYMGKIGPAVPIFLSSGNHENEEGWNLDDTPFSIAQGSIQARKLYYPTPISDTFYTGNTDPLAAINVISYGDQYREDYYAWEWGDALFMVIDPFQYTMNLPYAPTAGESNDDTVTGDQWSWTLGAQQYNWFKETLENSTATFKFIFSHQMVGGITRTISGVGPGYVRGGAEPAALFEWGGKNTDGTEGFAANRPGWAAPLHQLMVENHVSAYFHGHDHQYVYEGRDGIVYQEVPSPGMTGSGFTGIYTEGDHGTYTTVEMLANPGYLRITVSPTLATVVYVSSSGTANYTYTMNNPTAVELNSLAADAARGHVRVSWDAASEVDDLGYHVWRGTSANGARERLNASLIPSQAPGSPSGSHYEFVDETAVPGLTYYYWVEQVRTDGTTHLNGPISARASGFTKLPPARE